LNNAIYHQKHGTAAGHQNILSKNVLETSSKDSQAKTKATTTAAKLGGQKTKHCQATIDARASYMLERG